MALTVKNPLPPELLAIPEGTVAQLARRFLLDPFSSSSGPDLAQLSPEELHALLIASKSLSVSPEQVLSGQGGAHLRVVELLVDVLKSRALEVNRRRAAREGLGSSGLLPQSEYTIRFNSSLPRFEQLGARRAHIEQVLRQPHAVQHLPAPSETSALQGISLFVQYIQPAKGALEFLQMVVAVRRGSELSFSAAWRLYRQFVPWEPRTSLLDLLKQFVGRYGVYFSFGNSGPSRFLDFARVPVTPAQAKNLGSLVHIQTPFEHNRSDYIVNMTSLVTTDGFAEVAFGYVIDTTRYQQDMLSFGRR